MLCTCPACGSDSIRTFYQHDNAPVHSVLIHHTRAEALNLTQGQIRLGFCESCGFIYNMDYDPNLQDYSLEYESTQGFSPTFNAFANRLANHLVERYDLHHKQIIEIGCGQGEFLKLLCERGDNRGLGFDPAYVPGRVALTDSGQPEFIKDYYSEQYAANKADFMVCKMTLEHIQPVAEFVGTVRRAIGDHTGTTVFFQIPDVNRILEETAFWDVYYEHCSYFSLGSLARLFRRSGFEVIEVSRGYGDQYLMIEARPAQQTSSADGLLPAEHDLSATAAQVERFAARAPQVIEQWRARLLDERRRGKHVVLWGGGSKAVAFLTTLGAGENVSAAVDINPFKRDTFLAGVGTRVISPDELSEIRPDTVILMNPIYRDEIAQQLGELGLHPELLPVNYF